jgi:hypothetical protein
MIKYIIEKRITRCIDFDNKAINQNTYIKGWSDTFKSFCQKSKIIPSSEGILINHYIHTESADYEKKIHSISTVLNKSIIPNLKDGAPQNPQAWIQITPNAAKALKPSIDLILYNKFSRPV